MNSISFRKVKSVAKDIEIRGPQLWDKILHTMYIVSRVVGGTLGPGGCPVLIERQETGIPNMVTKDGVTVYRYLGFKDSTMHAIMESARDASVRTADEAGDGTTTATVLSEALVRYTGEYLRDNPRSSPQKVVRALETEFRENIEPILKETAKRFPLNEETQKAVVLCSTNGDSELTEAVLKCFSLTGDAGNVTILEESGPSGYKVEPLKGYSLGIGYEDSIRAFAPQFLNDSVNNRIHIEKPVLILYFGQITDLVMLHPLMENISNAQSQNSKTPKNFVIVATGYSDTVLAQLAANFKHPESTIKVVPILLPKSPIQNGELQVLQDLQSLTGGRIYDPLSLPLENASIDELGSPLDYFESMRYRCNIVGRADEDLVLMRVEEIEQALVNPISKHDSMQMKERIAKLSGGIAKLTVVGASTGEIREKRDRAEDAVCALRGSFKHGVVPGAGWAYLQVVDGLVRKIKDKNSPLISVLAKSLEEPFRRIAENSGLTKEEVESRLIKYYEDVNFGNGDSVWDGISDKFVSPVTSGIMDSLPAVLEALRNSLSIATLLATLGGTVVFRRDEEIERTESADAYSYLKNVSGD
jgi:chaperonin GroEL